MCEWMYVCAGWRPRDIPWSLQIRWCCELKQEHCRDIAISGRADHKALMLYTNPQKFTPMLFVWFDNNINSFFCVQTISFFPRIAGNWTDSVRVELLPVHPIRSPQDVTLLITQYFLHRTNLCVKWNRTFEPKHNKPNKPKKKKNKHLLPWGPKNFTTNSLSPLRMVTSCLLSMLEVC
jgi:hypothetical protein